MATVFSTSGENSDNIVVPTPQLQGFFIPGIDNNLAVDGFGIVTPWGGGRTTRRYGDYGIPTEVSQQSTQLYDLASSLIPAEGGISYNFEGLKGDKGAPGRDGVDGIIHVMGLGFPINSNFLAALPHNIDQINDLGTAVDKLIYTDTYDTYTELTWTERQPAGAAGKNWSGIATDSDGSNLIGVIWNGRLYTSSDSGENWAEKQPAGDTTKFWTCVASDNDGSNLIVGEQRLYTSADSGANWTERQPAGDANWNWDHVASDSDGSHLMAMRGGALGRLYTSANSGVDWTERQPAGDVNRQWNAIASDSDGSHLIAGCDNGGIGGRLYTSADSGENWTERQPAGAANKVWYDAASDSDGSNLIVAVYGGRLYTSANYGVDWTERRPIGDDDGSWWSVASDDDGSHLLAGESSGRLYLSEDSGATWTEVQPAGASNKQWRNAAIDSDGSNLLVAAYSSRLYTGINEELYSEATWAEASLTSAGRALLDDSDSAAQATTLGLGTGDSPTWTGATFSGLSVSSLVAADASKALESVSIGTGLDYTRPTLGLSHLGIEALTDPDEDKIMFWDDSETAIKWLGVGNSIAITTTTLDTIQDIRTTATPEFNQVTLGVDPTNIDHSVTKSYADALVAGAFWTDVDVGTTENVDLSNGLEAGDIIDDYTLVEGDRVLVKEQTDQTENGLYVVPASGAASRADDANTAAEIENKKCIPLNGTTTKHRLYFCISGDIELGVTDIKFAEVTQVSAHNTLSGIQGGQADQYYHFTNAEHTALAKIPALTYASDSFIKVTAEDTYAIRTLAEVKADLDLEIGTDVLAQQTIGIANDNLIEVDDADAVATDYARFTANGLEGRDATEVKTDLSLGNVENTAISSWAGSGNITTVGALASGSIAAGFTEIATDYTAAKCTDATADNTAGNETSHADVVVDGDFSSNGILNRTGAGVYSILALGTDVQAYHANLASVAGLTYAAAAFIKMTGANTFALRTIGETADDLEATIDHDNLANGGAHDYAYISGNDAGTGITAAELEELSDGSETTLHSHAGAAAFGRPIILTPQSGMPPATSFATLDTVTGGSTPAEAITVLDFDADSSEYMDFKIALPAGYASGGLTVTIIFSMTSDHDEGTPHKVRWEAAFARVADDALDLNGDQSYDFNGVSAIVPSIVGEVSYDNITFTDGADMDSLAAGEMAILRVYRDHDHADDNATGDAELHMIQIKET